MLAKISRMVMPALLAAIATSIFTTTAGAQVQTSTDTSAAGAATSTVKTERGEVVYVSGNDLVVRAEDGSIRHFPNVPDSVRVTVDGQQLSVHELKVGMKVQRTITTTTTPKLVTTVKSVKGKVWHVTPPNTVILTLEDNKNQEFKIPKGQKFDINGQMVDAWGLRPGMVITATKIVEVPEEVVTQQRKLTGSMPPAPETPPANQPLLVATKPSTAVPTTQSAAAEPAPAPVAAAKKLPKTASNLPLVGLLGLLSLILSLGLKFFRGTFSTRSLS
jgi:hypothetical protein